jgi:hypothetical protein
MQRGLEPYLQIANVNGVYLQLGSPLEGSPLSRLLA